MDVKYQEVSQVKTEKAHYYIDIVIKSPQLKMVVKSSDSYTKYAGGPSRSLAHKL